MSRLRFHVRRGDTVKVISGNHKGSSGKILQIISGKEQVIIEGVRMIKKHTRKSQDHPNGAIIEREGPVHISNVQVLEQPAAEKAEKKTVKKETKKPKAKKS
ncbi:MAG: 50S ribosomal protein L24 [Chthoniobacterales bacterium]